MLMEPRVRRFALTAHVVSSVGWLGSVAAFLALSVAGLTSGNAEVARGAYLAMNVIGAFIIVPLSVAALLTGLIQALGTQWGLFRYYWVLAKLTLTIGATLLLLLHQFTAVATAAKRVLAHTSEAQPDLGGLGTQLIGDASFAIVVLLVTTTLSIYKPWGRTPFGRRVEAHELGVRSAGMTAPLGVKILVAVIGAILATIIVSHLAGGGLRHNGM